MRMPATAAMAVRPWMSSACWYHLRASGVLPRPAGSKPKSPARLEGQNQRLELGDNRASWHNLVTHIETESHIFMKSE